MFLFYSFLLSPRYTPKGKFNTESGFEKVLRTKISSYAAYGMGFTLKVVDRKEKKKRTRKLIKTFFMLQCDHKVAILQTFWVSLFL